MDQTRGSLPSSDEPSFASIGPFFLRTHGFEVVTFTRGEEFLEASIDAMHEEKVALAYLARPVRKGRVVVLASGYTIMPAGLVNDTIWSSSIGLSAP